MSMSLRRKMALREQAMDARAVEKRLAGLSRAGQVARSTVPVGESDLPVVETLESAVDVVESLPGLVDTADQAGSDAYEAWDQSEFAKALALQLDTELGAAQVELSQALADSAQALADAGLARSEAASALADAADAVAAAGVASGQASQAITEALAAAGLASDAQGAAVDAAAAAALASAAAGAAQDAADQAASDAVSLSAAAEVAAKAHADAEAEAARLAAVAAASGDASAKAAAAQAAAEAAAAADASAKASAAEAAAKADAAAAQSTANQAVSDAAAAAGQAASALSAAQAAQGAANTAQATADGKNKTTRSTSDASGSGASVGDRWEKYDTLAAGGKLLAAWAWDGSGWRSVTLSATYLPQVDIGSGTFGSLSGSRLVASSVTTAELNALAVTAAKLAADSVTAVKIAANAVTAAKIEAGAVIADKIAAGAVTTVKLDALAVTAEKIAAGAIVADKIAANAITTAKLAATAIDGMTITGALIRTAASGQRLQFDVDGLKAFDSGGNQVAQLDSDTGGIKIGFMGSGLPIAFMGKDDRGLTVVGSGNGVKGGSGGGYSNAQLYSGADSSGWSSALELSSRVGPLGGDFRLILVNNGLVARAQAYGDIVFYDKVSLVTDTAWANISVSGATAGFVRWRRYLGRTYLRFDVTLGTAIGNGASATVFNVPAAAGHPEFLTPVAVTGVGITGYAGTISTGGTVTIANSSGAGRTRFYGAGDWEAV